MNLIIIINKQVALPLSSTPDLHSDETLAKTHARVGRG